MIPKTIEAPPSYLPKGWEGLSVRVLGATFGVAMPPGKSDVIADHPWEKGFTGVWTGKNITLGVNARHIFGLPGSDPSVLPRKRRSLRYLDLHGMQQDGSIKDAPLLGTSKGKEFRAKPDKDFKGTIIYRLWVIHGARFMMSVTGPSDLKPADAEEFFKTATAAAGSSIESPRLPGPKDWPIWYSPTLKLIISLPGEPQQVGGEDKIFLFWPKDATGGAMFTFSMIAAKLDPAVDEAKGYRSLEKAVREGQFGKDPRNLTKKNLLDRPGVLFELRDGDTVYNAWAVYNNEESAVVLRARKDAGLPPASEKLFFDSLQFGIDKPPQKKDSKGGPGVGPGGPGSPPGKGGGPPPPPARPSHRRRRCNRVIGRLAGRAIQRGPLHFRFFNSATTIA